MVNYRKNSAKTGPWSSEEDVTLLKQIKKVGTKSWNMVSRHVPGRTSKSCRLRWFNQLSPEINKVTELYFNCIVSLNSCWILRLMNQRFLSASRKLDIFLACF
uniref:Myb-related protein n=1 Tax=Tetraselmis sp. GSL018 TaxID=582737 RepID=A0A061R5C2_9CHLO